jgi:hypothetical protein
VAEIISLNKERKSRERAKKKRKSEANRRKFGESRIAKTEREAAAQKSDGEIDGRRLDAPACNDGPSIPTDDGV